MFVIPIIVLPQMGRVSASGFPEIHYGSRVAPRASDVLDGLDLATTTQILWGSGNFGESTLHEYI